MEEQLYLASTRISNVQENLKYTIVEQNDLKLKVCMEINLMHTIDNQILGKYSDVFEGLGCIANAEKSPSRFQTTCSLTTKSPSNSNT